MWKVKLKIILIHCFRNPTRWSFPSLMGLYSPTHPFPSPLHILYNFEHSFLHALSYLQSSIKTILCIRGPFQSLMGELCNFDFVLDTDRKRYVGFQMMIWPLILAELERSNSKLQMFFALETRLFLMGLQFCLLYPWNIEKKFCWGKLSLFF